MSPVSVWPRRDGARGGWALLGLAAALAATTACAQPAASKPAAPAAEQAYDPWESVNRGLFSTGMALDRIALAPISHGYMRATPEVVRNRVSAAVYNLGEPSTALEDVLQGHPKRAGQAGLRFTINSTLGLLGLFDVAGRWGLAGHESDFGQTLGRYGAQPGPYVFAIIGPYNFRDGLGRIVDVVTDPMGFVIGPITSTPGAVRAGVSGLDQRVAADPAVSALADATDPYVTTRSAYTQHRAAVVDTARGVTADLPDFDAGR